MNNAISGIDDKELLIYKSLLTVKRATVAQLARLAQEKRTNLYRYLDGLINKGLVSEIRENKRRIFIAESPSSLVKFFDHEKEKIKEMMPELVALENQAIERPKIRYFEGMEGLRVLYDEILKEKQEIVAVSTPEKVWQKIKFHEDFRQAREKRNIPVRMILPNTRFAKSRSANLRQAKFSNHLRPFDATYMIAGNKVAIYSTKNWITGVLIENHEIAEGLRAFFDAFWCELDSSKNS